MSIYYEIRTYQRSVEMQFHVASKRNMVRVFRAPDVGVDALPSRHLLIGDPRGTGPGISGVGASPLPLSEADIPPTFRPPSCGSLLWVARVGLCCGASRISTSPRLVAAPGNKSFFKWAWFAEFSVSWNAPHTLVHFTGSYTRDRYGKEAYKSSDILFWKWHHTLIIIHLEVVFLALSILIFAAYPRGDNGVTSPIVNKPDTAYQKVISVEKWGQAWRKDYRGTVEIKKSRHLSNRPFHKVTQPLISTVQVTKPISRFLKQHGEVTSFRPAIYPIWHEGTEV